jgi:very-short-patch-repair endonuclease
MSEVGQNMCVERAESGPVRVDRLIGALAARQHGVVTRAQLRDAGLSDAAITRRLPAGRLHRLHTGVYAVGHPVLGRRGRWMAAVLACGPGAALSHASAAALWELRASASAWIDVTVPRTGKRTRERIRIHRPRTLGPDEVTTRDGIPVTTPARTILDMAATLQESRLEHLLDQAEIRELTDYPALEALATAHPGHRGAGKLRAALRRHDAGTDVARSDLEILFKELCRARGLPAPRVNHRVEGKEVDFLFEAQKLVVETDSWRYHKTRHAFENDRARDAKLARAGYRTLRFTDTQIAHRAAAVAETIAVALVQGSPGERAA